MKNDSTHINAIDSLLPQTQCGDCGYQGCRPYAEAIHKGDTIDKCLPGGVKVLRRLGELLGQDITPYMADMRQKAKPKRLAVIRETECIGCTKCVQACPVDAIIGAAKQMHTVLSAECTGCGLCVEPCPMDCIDMPRSENQDYQPQHARLRYQRHLARTRKTDAPAPAPAIGASQEEKKKLIAQALARIKAKNQHP